MACTAFQCECPPPKKMLVPYLDLGGILCPSGKKQKKRKETKKQTKQNKTKKQNKN